jgi:hypothetical protein
MVFGTVTVLMMAEQKIKTMKTLTNIRKTEKHFRTLFLIALFVFQVALKASEVPATTEVVAEMEQEVETWMLDLSTWANVTSTFSSAVAVETEQEIEEWMTNPNDKVWDTTSEEELVIENWMYDLKHCLWNDCVQEEEMEIEAWMTDISEWTDNDQLLTIASYK